MKNLCLLLIACLMFAHATAAFSAPAKRGIALRVVDGDTFVASLNAVRIKIRLLGVDAPERARKSSPEEPHAEQSRRTLEDLVADEELVITFDANQGRHDEFGRLLAYVARARDGLFVNGEMIRLGQARVLEGYKLDRRSELEDLQREAIEAQRGVWKR